jgi:hypothetical protein
MLIVCHVGEAGGEALLPSAERSRRECFEQQETAGEGACER